MSKAECISSGCSHEKQLQTDRSVFLDESKHLHATYSLIDIHSVTTSFRNCTHYFVEVSRCLFFSLLHTLHNSLCFRPFQLELCVFILMVMIITAIAIWLLFQNWADLFHSCLKNMFIFCIAKT